MFVGDTFLTIFDRLSVKSVLTGKTGSLLGVIGSVAFIIISFIIFIGPVIFYFQGDYTQGIYTIIKDETMKLYTGCDFKIAISFYSKANNQIVDMSRVKNFMQTKVRYSSPSGRFYEVDPIPCQDSYFSQMQNKPHQFKSQDCLMSPNGLQYQSQLSSGYISTYGFFFNPICLDPFLCTATSNTADSTSQRLTFFKDNYYVLRFTATYVDNAGQLKKKFYEIYSTQWSGHDTVIPFMWSLYESTKIYLDNSIMPWYNNQTKIFVSWSGNTYGRKVTQDIVAFSSVGAFISLQSEQKVLFRQYRKLDWLLGMIGGGVFLLFLIFWVVCNFISTTKQKIQNCQSCVLVRSPDHQSVYNLQKPSFNIFWYLSTMLPFKINCFKKQNKVIQESQKLIDIAQLIKKLKVAVKNLKMNKIPTQFVPSLLQANMQRENTNFNQEQLKYQINFSQMKKLKQSRQTPLVYEDNLLILSLYNNQGRNDLINNKMKQIMSDDAYSKHASPQLNIRQRQGRCVAMCSKIGKFLSQFFKFFDVFGARPTLAGNPQNYSGVGCVLTFLIIILAILTFALTLGNMGVTRTYWDQIYIPAQQQKIKSTTGKQFRSAICVHPWAFSMGLVTGQDRIVDFKFYQYKRKQGVQTQRSYDMIRMNSDSSSYFDLPNNAYSDITFRYCFRPNDGIPIQVYGDQHSEEQAYVGIKIVPRCVGLPADCYSKRNVTYTNFYNLISTYPMYFVFPEANYYPDQKKVVIAPDFLYLSQYANYLDLNYTQPIQKEVYLDTLQLVDNYASWIMGDFPKPKKQMMSKYFKVAMSHLKSIPATNQTEPYFRLKIGLNGNVKRVIFSSYKIDFLFATIGGCFIFYFFFFGCFGKAYNHYKMKVKLAQVLYNQQIQTSSAIKSFLNWARVICCKDEVIAKIQQDIQCTKIAKNVDNVYRLSAARYSNSYQRSLGLVYLKQRIRFDQQVVVKGQESSSSSDEDDFFDLDWEATKRQQKRRLNPNSINNIDDAQSHHQAQLQKEQIQSRRNMHRQTLNQPHPSARQSQKCGNFLNNFDIFHNNSQFTLDGKRTVKSVFGGMFCICLLIFICVLTSHFLTIYFSQFHVVSETQIVDQKSQARKMKFTVGQNFKLAVSFYKADDFKFFDVSNITKDVGISIIKYKEQLLQGYRIQTEIQKIDLQHCRSNYLQGFIDMHDDPEYYKNFDKAYCVPDGVQLDLYGSADDPIRQYFSLKIQNKYAYNNTLGVQKVTQLLKNYLPRYHISNPRVDFRANGTLRYSTDQVIKSMYYQTATSRTYNITMTKNIIQYDTAVNPTNERPAITSYQVQSDSFYQYANSYIENIDRYNELNFYPEEMYRVYVIRTIKVNQIFGIIGGCIGLLFLGLGCIPRSYNQYKMRYMIGKKLYVILGRKKQPTHPNKKGKLSTSSTRSSSSQQQLEYFSQFRLMRAWVMSVWGFAKNNHNTNDTLRIASLIEQRVGKDINIFEFLKNVRICERGIRKMELMGDEELDLGRVFGKHVVEIGDEGRQKEMHGKLLEDLEGNTPLIDAIKVNELSYYDINKIIKAKNSNQVNVQNILTQRWLDKYFNISRPSTVAASSEANLSELRSTNSYQRSNSRKDKQVEKGRKKEKDKKSVSSETKHVDRNNSHQKLNQFESSDMREKEERVSQFNQGVVQY